MPCTLVHPPQAPSSVGRRPMPQAWPPALRDLLLACWASEPSRRCVPCHRFKRCPRCLVLWDWQLELQDILLVCWASEASCSFAKVPRLPWPHALLQRAVCAVARPSCRTSTPVAHVWFQALQLQVLALAWCSCLTQHAQAARMHGPGHLIGPSQLHTCCTWGPGSVAS